MAEGGFDFKKLLDETKATLITPAEYFAIMPKEGGLGEPLVKAVIYSLIAGVFTFVWGALKLTAAAGAFGGMIGGGIGIMGLIWSIVGGIIGLFIGGAIVLVISAICGGNTNYEANVRVTASLMALSPVSAILSFLSGFSLWIGGLVSLAVALYGLYLLYIAVTRALGGKEGTAKVISILLAVIPVLMILSTLLCVKAASNFSDQIMKDIPTQNQEQFKKLSEDFNKAIEDAKKAAPEEGDKDEEQ